MSYYIYGLLDPSSNEVFYIGKGSGNRAISHIKNVDEQAQAPLKSQRIKNIQRQNLFVRIIVLVKGLETESEAFTVESLLIHEALSSRKVLGLSCNLTNSVSGHHQERFRPIGRPQDIEGFEFEEISTIRGETPKEYVGLFEGVIKNVDIFREAVKKSGQYIRSAKLSNGFEFVVNPSSANKVVFEYIARTRTDEQKKLVMRLGKIIGYSTNENHCKLYCTVPNVNVYGVEAIIKELNGFISLIRKTEIET